MDASVRHWVPNIFLDMLLRTTTIVAVEGLEAITEYAASLEIEADALKGCVGAIFSGALGPIGKACSPGRFLSET
jgi:hypothetical protein